MSDAEHELSLGSRPEHYIARDSTDFAALMPSVSGNSVNGLGQAEPGPPQPFFWHPPDQHAFGAL